MAAAKKAVMVKGFCAGCPTPENLAQYRAGKKGGGYFSDPGVREVACQLVEAVAQTGSCLTGQPQVEDLDEEGDQRVRTCAHSAWLAIAQIGDAMEKPGESPEIINMIDSERGKN